MLITIAIIYLAIMYIHNRLTYTEGWYKENWSTFFKRVIYGKLHCKEFNVTGDRQSTQVP